MNFSSPLTHIPPPPHTPPSPSPLNGAYWGLGGYQQGRQTHTPVLHADVLQPPHSCSERRKRPENSDSWHSLRPDRFRFPPPTDIRFQLPPPPSDDFLFVCNTNPTSKLLNLQWGGKRRGRLEVGAGVGGGGDGGGGGGCCGLLFGVARAVFVAASPDLSVLN